MKRLIENRRDFLKHASIAAAFPFLLNCKSGTLAQQSGGDILSSIKKNAIADPTSNWSGARDAPSNVGWTTKLAPDSDKGERILISGTVFLPDGKTPAPNTLIYLYHTDIYGIYGQNGEHRHGRYRGWMLTDSHGRYEFESIRPAPYPENRFAAHVHMTLTTKDSKEDWIDSILFEGDRLISGGPDLLGHVGERPQRSARDAEQTVVHLESRGLGG
mgnify:CR=1 FL=1